MITITPSELLAFQLQHYALRLSEARSTEEKMFLRQELWRLRQKRES